jgi:hypothetical protein
MARPYHAARAPYSDSEASFSILLGELAAGRRQRYIRAETRSTG